MSPENTRVGATGDQIGRPYKARFSCMTYLDLLRAQRKPTEEYILRAFQRNAPTAPPFWQSSA